jgi:phosphonate transport system substrate-binding protein
MPISIFLSRRVVMAMIGFAVLPLSALAQDKSLVVGVLNQQSASKTAERWNPILRHLAEVTGLTFSLRMGATVQDTNAMMGRGDFDLVFSNHNFRPEYDGTYKVLASWSEKPIYGVIAVLKDSPVHSIKDLAGKKVVFPSRNAFVAYAVPMAALRSSNVAVDPVFAAHQEGALAQLKAGSVTAAAVNSRFLSQYAARSGLVYREIFTSEGFADLPISVHPRVANDQSQAIRKALLGMRGNPKANEALAAASFEGFAPAVERDYDNARAVYKLAGD